MTAPDVRVREALAAAEVDGLRLRLVGQLDRKEYVLVDKVLQAMGGKWDRRQRAHVFSSDPAPALAEFLAGGEAPKHPRAAEGYVATPDDVADLVVREHTEVDDLPARARVLEPSAGDGALVRAIRRANPGVDIVAVEPNPDRAARIDAADIVMHQAIEAFTAKNQASFDAVVMNPPFALPGAPTAWVDHVRLAWGLLAAGGRLTSIVPAGFAFRQGKRHEAIREFVAEHGGWADLPADAFKASGTGIRACVTWADKL